MSVSIRKLLSVCARTSVVSLIASTAVMPIVANAAPRVRQTAEVKQENKNCREPRFDTEGRPLPGNVGGKRVEVIPVCEPKPVRSNRVATR